MALYFSFKHWCVLAALLLSYTSCCKSDREPGEIVERALSCFNSGVYSSCQESYRLSPQGTINVPRQAIDDYCNGPCLDETNLVLSCIDSILYNFQFYNGASTKGVRYSLKTGCGHGSRRGDFNTQERINSRWGGDYYDYNHGDRLAVPIASLMAILSCALLVWIL